MIYLKKPYSLVAYTSSSKTFNVYGKSFYNVTNVYLSGAPYTNTTFYSPFSSVPRLSALYPGFSAVKLSRTSFTSNNDNTIVFTMPSATQAGFIDVIVENIAGYGRLTQCVIKELYSGNLTLQELRPWSTGIKVLTGAEIILPDQIITFNGDILVTIQSEENIVAFYD
jgi:hypothetical protein